MNDDSTRYAMWLAKAHNPLGEEIARIMAEGRHREAYDTGPEFHYAIVAAIRAPDSNTALRYLLDTFEELQETKTRIMDHAIELAKSQPPPIILVKEVDKHPTV